MTRKEKLMLVGALAIIVVPLVIGFGIPSLLRFRLRRKEASARSALRKIVALETAYAKSHPRQGYICGPFPSEDGRHMPDEMLSIRQIFNESSTYYYGFEFNNCSAVGFWIVAKGPSNDETWWDMFCSDQTGVIHVALVDSECDEKSPVWVSDRP